MKLRLVAHGLRLFALACCLSVGLAALSPAVAWAQPEEPAETAQPAEETDAEAPAEPTEEAATEEPASEEPAEEHASETELAEEIDEEIHGESTHGEHESGEMGHGDDHGHEHGSAESHGVLPHGTNEDPTEVKHDLALWSFVVFVLLLLILWKFAWGPIVAGLEKRENHIAGMIKQAEDNAESSRKQLAEHEAKLAGAHEEIRQLLDTAHREAEAQKQEIVAEAQKVAANEKERALREISAAKDSALGEIAQKSVDEAFSLASKIVRRELNPQEHQQLVQDAVRQFPSSN